MGFDTVATIVSEASVELGLGAVTDVFGSTNPRVVQLRALLKSIGQALVLEHVWIQCTKEHSFTTTAASEYDLPADFEEMVPQTAWNRTSQKEMGPASPSTWQYLQASSSVGLWTCLFRPRDGTLELWPQPPTVGDEIAFEYRSRYWVAVTAAPTVPVKDAPTLNTDVIRINGLLMKRALKFAYKKAKGFDSAAEQLDFEATLEAVREANAAPGPVIDLNGGRGEKLLDLSNAPTTGFGFEGGGLF